MGNAHICAHVLTLAQLWDLSHYCYGMIKATLTDQCATTAQKGETNTAKGNMQTPESVQKKVRKGCDKEKKITAD